MASQPVAPDPIARRIRARRAALGLSLGQATARAGLKSASFLHHIERGERLPSEHVAAWLAAALQEDEELLRAWVRLRRGAPLELALPAARLLERHLAAEPEHGDEAAAPPLLMRVPRLEWGVDPGGSPAPAAAEVLRFDPRALPREAWLRPFAYRIPAGESPPPPLLAGDLVLVTRNAWPLQPAALYLVRAEGGPRLSRAAWREGTLWLEAEVGPARPLPPSGTPPGDLLGRVAAVIRAGPATPEA